MADIIHLNEEEVKSQLFHPRRGNRSSDARHAGKGAFRSGRTDQGAYSVRLRQYESPAFRIPELLAGKTPMPLPGGASLCHFPKSPARSCSII